MRKLSFLLTLVLAACAGKDDPEYWIARLTDSDPKVVDDAIVQLGRLGDVAGVEPLCKLYDTHPRAEILRAILALKDVPGFDKKTAVPTLIKALDFSEDTYNEATIAAEGLGALGATEAVPALVKVLDRPLSLKSRANLTKLAAIQVLGVLKSKEATDGLIRAMERPAEEQDFAVAKAAPEALGVIGDPKAVRPLIRALFRAGRGLQMYPEARVALVKIGNPAVQPLIDAFQRKDAELEAMAKELEFFPGILEFKTALALGELRAKEAIPTLREALRGPAVGDEHEESRNHNGALTALGMIGTDEVVDDLLWALEKHKDWKIRAKAAEMLNVVGSTRALPNLLKAAKSGYFTLEGQKFNEIRWAAALAFSKNAGPEGYAQLEPIVKAATPEAGRDIFDEALKRLELSRDCKDDVACYAKALDDPVLAKQEAAAFQLARRPEAKSQLAALAAKVSHREPVNRLAVLHAIDRLADKTCKECIAKLEEQIEQDKRKTVKALGGDLVNEMRCTLARIQAK